MSLLAAAAGLTAGALGAAGLSRLRERPATPQGLSDLLGWGFLVGEGVVLMKDGSFLAAWRVRGRDLASSTAAEVVNLAGHANAALASLGDGWMVHADALRRDATGYAPPERCHFPDPVSAAIDSARRARYASVGEHYETETVLTATYTPPAGLASELQKRLVKGRDAGSASEVWDRLVGQFERDLRSVSDRLSAAMRVERLGSVALLCHLHECLTGLCHDVGVPGRGAYLDYALADQPFVGGFEPRVGQKHVRVVAVQGYPNATTPGLADPALRLPFPYRWSVRFLPLSPATAVKAIGKAQLGWFQKRRGAGDWVKDLASKQKRETTEMDLAFQDGNATQMVHDAGAARAANSGGEVRFGYLTVGAVVMADDRRTADERAAALLKAVRDLGFTGRVEDVNAVDAFLGTLPGHGHPNLRRPLLTTENVVDVLPLTAPWGGHEAVPSQLFPPDSPPLLWAKTDGSTPFRLCLHEGDVGHTLVVGATGAGKSVLVGLLLAQWRRYARARTVTFDVGYSHYVSGRAMGAAHYDLAGPLAAQNPVQMQPLRDVHLPEVRTWAVDWVEQLVELQGQALTPEERGRLAHAVGLLAENPPEGRTLTALLVNLGTERLRALVRPYTLEGAYGQLFDADRDSFGGPGTGPEGEGGTRHQVVELSHLVGMSDRVLVPALTYLFRRVEESLDGSPTLIVIEEAWAALMHGRFADRLRQWLLTLRKRNASVVVVAHSPAQFRDSAVKNAQLIVESCPTRIFLPNPDAVEPDTAALYRWLGLNEAEVARLARARKKRDYYVRSPSGARMFDLALSPVEVAFLTTLPGRSADETVREAAQLAEAEGERWPAEWLRLCGLHANVMGRPDPSDGLRLPEGATSGPAAPPRGAGSVGRAPTIPVGVTPGPTRSAR
jgi:type IV secretion system protein VirB4